MAGAVTHARARKCVPRDGSSGIMESLRQFCWESIKRSGASNVCEIRAMAHAKTDSWGCDCEGVKAAVQMLTGRVMRLLPHAKCVRDRCIG